MLAGIYEPSEGDILFDLARVNDVEARDRNVGIVFQSYALYPHMTARENILFPLRFKRMPRAEAVRRAEATARLVQIEDLLGRRPSEMSGGQQQRVALARALVKEPQLLLLDEPLSNLDASLRLTMRSEIRRLQRSLGVTTILVTHDQIEATSMADRIICMSRGRIEQIGTADDLYQRPDSLFVAGFIGSPPINLLPGEAQAGGIRVGEAMLPIAHGHRQARWWSAYGPSMCSWTGADPGADRGSRAAWPGDHLSPVHPAWAGAGARARVRCPLQDRRCRVGRNSFQPVFDSSTGRRIDGDEPRIAA